MDRNLGIQTINSCIWVCECCLNFEEFVGKLKWKCYPGVILSSGCWINFEMGVSQNDSCRMEGWLYLIRSNRFGLQYSRKRYFVLHDLLLKSYKSNPVTNNEVYHSLTLFLCVLIEITIWVKSHCVF